MIKKIRGFLRLIDRYQKRDVDPGEQKILDLWYDSIDFSEQNKDALSEEQAGKVMWAAIEGGMDEEERQKPRIFVRAGLKNIYFKLAAACVVLVLGLLTYRTLKKDAVLISGVKNEVLGTLLSVHNRGAGQMNFTLSDGSRAVLDPGASLFYPAAFERDQRTVFLKGNVFFEIAHDRTRPFFVHANNIVTKVLGTSFTVRENAKTKSIEVAVMTGVVEVRKAEGLEERNSVEDKVVLTQNKKVTFFEADEKLVTGLVEKPTLIANQPDQVGRADFNYAEKALPDILDILEKAYGVHISIRSEKLRNCIINADLSQENTLFSQLEILCESINAQYQLAGDTVTLSGEGCELTKQKYEP
jgi:transmembrane sensor